MPRLNKGESEYLYTKIDRFLTAYYKHVPVMESDIWTVLRRQAQNGSISVDYLKILQGKEDRIKSGKSTSPKRNGLARRINDAGLAVIREFERGPNGDYAAYKYRDPVGNWTIGWGHLIKRGESFNEPMSRADADALLQEDLSDFEECVERKVDVPLSDNQFGALVSFAFNLGCGNLGDSTLLKKLNNGDYDGAADEFQRWVYAGGQKFNGLIRRRKMERELFVTPDVVEEPEPEPEPEEEVVEVEEPSVEVEPVVVEPEPPLDTTPDVPEEKKHEPTGFTAFFNVIVSFFKSIFSKDKK